MKTHYQLTAEIQQTICAYIRAGGFPHVAAEAAGIPHPVFEQWLESGQKKRPKEEYRLFFDAVRQAKAQARLAAEMKAFEEDPVAWLKAGPGKETTACPGWTVPVKPQITQDNRQVNVLLEPQMMGIFATLLQLLAPFPEARAAIAAALAGMKDTPLLDHKM